MHVVFDHSRTLSVVCVAQTLTLPCLDRWYLLLLMMVFVDDYLVIALASMLVSLKCGATGWNCH
jgi:hypothetical protein